MGKRLKRNAIAGQFSARLIEMLESPAWRILGLSDLRVLSRAEIELGHHAGHDNGKLPITHEQWIDYGVRKDSLPGSLRVVEALGFLKCTKRGRGGNAEHREPSWYALTYVAVVSGDEPNHEWRKVKTDEQAQEIVKTARGAKDPKAVAFGKRSAPRRPNFKVINGNLREAITAPTIVGDKFSALIVDEDEEIRLRGVVQ